MNAFPLRCRSLSWKPILLFISVFAVWPSFAGDVPGNRFVYSVLRHEGTWDPYGDLWPEIAQHLRSTTSINPWPDRRVLGSSDPALFESPFLVLAGRGAVAFSSDDADRLRAYLSAGGFLLVDNSEADPAGPFARSVSSLPARLFPDGEWKKIPSDNAVFRSFFLLKEASGRRKSGEGLKGLWVGGRLAAVYSPDDLEGPWVRSPAGGWLFPCEPGGEPQRLEARKLLVNIVMFSLTGTYKTDAVHQEYLKRKLDLP
jgi:hypothetical protein